MRIVRSLIPLILLLAAGGALHADWPHVRGPETDGSVAAPGTFEKDAGLAAAWRVPLGSGYSGVAVVGGSAVTAFADGEFDWVGAFDVASGASRWRRQLGPRTKGIDGADDGPLSSPVIGGGRVYMLASDGRLWAVALADGAVAWSRDLATDLAAPRPHFGFATTPLYVDGTLIVQIGGADSQSLVGLDPKTGTTRWTAGEDAVTYQSPSVMTLAGTRQVVAVGNRWLIGLVPADGRVLWRLDLGEQARSGSSMPVHAGGNRVLVPRGGGVTVYGVTQADDGFAANVLYESETLGGGYARPVYHDGHLYGFRGQVLTCADAATGERVWRSRPPGGDGLIAVEGRLVIFGSKGRVVLADASPDGYREIAAAEALEGSSLTWPSFSDGRVFVRNLDSLAAVGITATRSPSIDTEEGGEHGVSSWLRSLDGVDEPARRAAAVDDLLARHETLPWVDGEWLHFLYRGAAAEDVSLVGTMLDADVPVPMHRLPGTDLFYRSVRVAPGGRWEYRFKVDFDAWVTDPANPRTVPVVEGDGMNSEVLTPGYVGVSLALPLAEDASRGRMESFTLASDALGYDKTVRVWLPPGYDADANADRRYPLLVVPGANDWIDRAGLVDVLDALVERSMRPIVAAFVDPADAWWTEAGGSQTAEFATLLATELPAELAERYRLAEGAASRAVLANRFYAAAAVYASLAHPGSFGHVAVESVYTALGAGDRIMAMIHDGVAADTTFDVGWFRYDERNVDRGYDFAAQSRELHAALEHAGYGVGGGEALDSYGWGGWRNRAARTLQALYPAD